MADAGERETIVWQAIVQSKTLADEARRVGLDTLAYLLEMVVMEAKQETVVKQRGGALEEPQEVEEPQEP